ncbi:MAG: N-acetyltransferase [Methanomicrobiaceae archaeon]|nr:N-acetyltransferase [Methanomicrobiaceae archaeon]
MENFIIGKNSRQGKYLSLGEEPLKEKGRLQIGDNSTIRSHTVIYKGTTIGDNFQTGHGALIRENNVIGDNVSIGSHTILECDNNIGNNVRIHSNCFIPEFVIIEDDVWIGPSVTILNTLHPPCPRFSDCAKGVVIKKGAKIGGNVTIGPKTTIGTGSLIGFGSVVTSDIPENSVAVGNPARVIKSKKELKCVMNFFERPYIWE